jgi:hypothetical protein
MPIGRLTALVARAKRPTPDRVGNPSDTPYSLFLSRSRGGGSELAVEAAPTGAPPATATRTRGGGSPFSSSFPSTRAHHCQRTTAMTPVPTEEMMAAPLPAPLPACASSHGERAAIKWLGGGAQQAFPAGRGRSRLVLLRGASACRCAPRSSGTARPQKRRRSFASDLEAKPVSLFFTLFPLFEIRVRVCFAFWG